MDISAFSRQHLGFDSLLRKCHKIEILVDLLTGDLKEQKTMKERKIHQGCSLFFMQLTVQKWETPYLLWGGIVFLLTISTALNSAHLSKPEPLDKSNCRCHLQNGICDI